MSKPSQLMKEYRTWILSHHEPYYTVRETHDFANRIYFETDYATACVSFALTQWEIIELRISDPKDETKFYLHFELQELNHAKELFEEMMTCLLELRDHTQTKILLSCSSALTTSFFADKLNEAARALALDYDFSAVSYDRLFEKGFESDVILLAPQIGYLYHQASQILKEKTVLLIPASVFGTYNSGAVIDLVRKNLSAKKKLRVQQKNLHYDFMKKGVRLVMAIISEFGGNRIIYRVYDNGRVRQQNTIIKPVLKVRDLEDITDVVLTVNPDVETIAVSTPGVIRNGRLTYHHCNIINEDVTSLFKSKYKRHVVFVNDANSMAVGYYEMQDQYQNLIFYFHPHASRTAGSGIVMDGHLHTGSHAIAGETRYLKNLFFGVGADTGMYAWTPEGALEIMTQYLTAEISAVDPEAVVISCDMVTDVEQVRKSLAMLFPEACIPDLIKVDDVTDYMFAGCMAVAGQSDESNDLKN